MLLKLLFIHKDKKKFVTLPPIATKKVVKNED